MNKQRIVVALSGASGVILGIRLLEELKKHQIETHLVMSEWAEYNIQHETNFTLERVRKLASVSYDIKDMAAAISSGTFQTDGMVIVPCSMKTLASISCGFSHNLIARAADVTIKEKRKLIVVPRETPLSTIHLKNMLDLAQMGVIVLPPCLEFYTQPKVIDDLINCFVGRIMDSLGINNEIFPRWGDKKSKKI